MGDAKGRQELALKAAAEMVLEAPGLDGNHAGKLPGRVTSARRM
jgi:hypothetical protein